MMSKNKKRILRVLNKLHACDEGTARVKNSKVDSFDALWRNTPRYDKAWLREVLHEYYMNAWDEAYEYDAGDYTTTCETITKKLRTIAGLRKAFYSVSK